MISNIHNLKKARELRLSGKSLSEISREINISPSTLSLWLKDIVLNDRQILDLKTRISHRVSRGRLNASIALKSGRIFREKKIFDDAEKDFFILIKEPFFILGMTLYWVKGAKKGSCFQFASSDLSMISIMSIWIKKYLKIDDSLIKRREYATYYRIDVSRIDVLRRVVAWQKLLVQYYDRVLNE